MAATANSPTLFPDSLMLGFRKKNNNRIFILFLFTSLPTLQKWSGKDPGNYKSIKGRLSEKETTQFHDVNDHNLDSSIEIANAFNGYSHH